MKKILTIDDSSSIRLIVKSALEKHNYEILEAENGIKALELVQSVSDIAFFLVDLNMPEMDGLTFVKELRQIDNYSKTPVVMLTTENQIEKKNEGKEVGANGWIVKPFEPDQLLKIIQALVK